MYLDSSNFNFVEREFPEKTTEEIWEEGKDDDDDVTADTVERSKLL